MMKTKMIFLGMMIMMLWTSCTQQDWIDTGVSSPYHDCSMMEYLRRDTAHWKLTVELIERGGLTDLFEGKDPAYPGITFFGPPSFSVLRYIWDEGLTSVNELDVDWCREMVLRHVVKGKHLKEEIAYRNPDFSVSSPSQNGCTDFVCESGNRIRVYRDKSDYGGVAEAGPITMSVYSFYARQMVPMASPDIQPQNGVVHALNDNYELGKI